MRERTITHYRGYEPPPSRKQKREAIKNGARKALGMIADLVVLLLGLAVALALYAMT